MKSATELANDLTAFTGSEHSFRYPLNSAIVYTDGVAYFAETAGAYWLFDIITTQPEILDTMKAGMAVIKLQANDDSTALLTCTDGDYNVTYIRPIDFTDCPVGTWEFWFTDNTILLPSEY